MNHDPSQITAPNPEPISPLDRKLRDIESRLARLERHQALLDADITKAVDLFDELYRLAARRLLGRPDNSREADNKYEHAPYGLHG